MRRSLSAASTLYQEIGRAAYRAKSAAKVVLPVPARPLIIVALQHTTFSTNRLSKRWRDTLGDASGTAIFSWMSCSSSFLISTGLTAVILLIFPYRDQLAPASVLQQ